MWGLIGKLLLGLALSIISAALSYRKPENTIEAEDEVGYPKTEEGSEIGKVFGTVWVKSPQVVWSGDLKTKAIVVRGPRRFGIVGPRSRTVVGYKYFLGVHFVPSLGPVDQLLAIKVQEKFAWRGAAQGLAVSGDRLNIDNEDLFGGEKREGGLSGNFDFLSGYPTQGRNSYLQRILGTSIPAFRGVTGVILRQMYLGTSSYLKPWQFLEQRVFVGDQGEAQWYPAKAGIKRPGLTFRNAAVYIAYDRSNSMRFSGSEEGQRIALQGFLARARDENIEDQPSDFMLAGFGDSPAENLTVRDAQTDEYDSLISWLDDNYLGNRGGTDYEAAFTPAPAFFADSGSKQRIVIFLTDGQPTQGLTEAQEILAGIANVAVYCFNIDLLNTDATSLLDNTPEDGVPVVSGGDPDAIVVALSQVFSNGYDMNPAHILREVLIARDTNGSGDGAEIGASFAAAADQLYSEGFGLSFFWANPSDKAAFIKEVEAHIDGKVYQDRRTGLWEIKLIRADYDVESLPVFDRSNVVEWGDDIEWPDPASLPNQVTVVYSDPDRDEPASITLTNPARVQALGRIINRKAEFRGINNATVGGRVAGRELAGASAPLMVGSIRARYVSPDLNLGDPIVLHNPRLGIYNVVVRIGEITDGDGRQNDVEIRFAEDKYSLPDSTLVPVEAISSTTPRPIASEVRLVEEAPYYFVATEAGQADVDAVLTETPGTGWLMLTGQQPNGQSIEFDAWRDAGAGYLEATENVQFCPVATLLSNMSARADETLIVVDAAGVDGLSVGGLAKIGTEYVRIDDVVTPAVYAPGDYWEPVETPTVEVALVTVGRGCLDTSPAEQAAGEPVIFWTDFADNDDTVYADGASVSVKLRTVASSGVLSLARTPTDVVTFASRAIRPYPPGAVQVDGSYAAPLVWDGTLALTWAHRDRLQQISPAFDDHTAASIGPEAGTTYRVVVWALDITGAVSGAALLDAGGLTGTSYSLDTSLYPAPAGVWGVRVELSAERDGYASTRNRSVDIPVLVTPSMLPGGTWLDVNDISSLWQDSDQTVAVAADGDPLGLIVNQRGTIV